MCCTICRESTTIRISLLEMSLWIEALGTAITSSFSKEVTPSSPSAVAEQKLVGI